MNDTNAFIGIMILFVATWIMISIVSSQNRKIMEKLDIETSKAFWIKK